LSSAENALLTAKPVLSEYLLCCFYLRVEIVAGGFWMNEFCYLLLFVVHEEDFTANGNSPISRALLMAFVIIR
jgi:hypothetical protein